MNLYQRRFHLLNRTKSTNKLAPLTWKELIDEVADDELFENEIKQMKS